MNRRIVVLAGVALIVVAGCDFLRPVDPNGPVNQALTQSLGDEAIHNAVIRQHTLYPYHFVVGGADLNELGRRDMEILIDHYRKAPGPLNLRRGDEDDALYQARIELVVKVLTDAELNAGQIPIADGAPGGAGMASDEVIEILHPQAPASPTLTIPTVPPGASAQGGF